MYNLRSVHFNNHLTGWAVGDSGTILKTSNGGYNWNVVSGITTNKLFSVIFFVNNSTGWIVGELGTILKTTNSGITWFSQTSPTTRWLKSIYFVNTDTAFICGDRGTILKTTNGGSNWYLLASNTLENLNSIYFVNTSVGWIIGENGTILKTDDGGSNWFAQTSYTLQELKSVFFIDENMGWIAGDNGVILKTNDTGINWYAQTSTSGLDLNDISFSDINNGIAVGVNGIILSTNDGGSSWHKESTPVITNLNSGIIINSNNCWVVGDYGTILTKTIGLIVDPEEVTVSTKDPIRIDINILSVSNLFGVSLTIKFDNFIVKCDSVKQGDFLINNPGNNDVFFEYLPNNTYTADSIVIDQAILGTQPVSGSGTLVTLYFTAQAAGTTDVTIENIQLRDNYNQPISNISRNGRINVNVPVINAKIFLQGPYTSNSMSTYLNNSGLIPLSQPYSGLPWNYDGTESVSNDFFTANPDIVDWVLIQLRTVTASSTTVATRAAFLKSNGVVVDLDGNSPISFFVSGGTQEYYLVIKHRNHLPVMSSLSFQINENTPLYNFTIAQNKAYGVESMVNLGDGNYGLFAGDANGNGQIQNNDSENFWKTQYGIFGYYNGDFNLNTQVQNNDRETYWRSNYGKGSHVPN